MVDLLVDLGGTLGLLLGYSLMSLVDLLETVIAWAEGRRRLRRQAGADAAPVDGMGHDATSRAMHSSSQRKIEVQSSVLHS